MNDLLEGSGAPELLKKGLSIQEVAKILELDVILLAK
jgi:hypothetical protein